AATGVDLAPLHRKVYLVRAFVALDHFDLGAEHVLKYERMLAGGRGLSGRPEHHLAMHDVFELIEPRGIPHRAARHVAIHIANPGEFHRIELRLLVAEQRLEPREA